MHLTSRWNQSMTCSSNPDTIDTTSDIKQPSYINLFKQQLAHLRNTDNSEAALSLFSEMKQTGLPIPCTLYQEIFLALNSGKRFFQVENMYQQMRLDGVVPDIGCLFVRLQV